MCDRDENKPLVFIVSLTILSSIIIAFVYSSLLNMSIGTTLYMVVPFCAILIAYKGDLRNSNLGITFKPDRTYLFAFLPLPFCLLLVVLGSLQHNVRFVIDFSGLSHYGYSENDITNIKFAYSFLNFPSLLIFSFNALISGLTINSLFAFFEEIAWRGFLYNRFIEKGFIKASIYIGVIWGVWHLPLVLKGYNYPNHKIIGLFLMVAFCILYAFILNIIRYKTGSIWVCSAFHGLLNASAQIPIMFLSGGDELIVGVTSWYALLITFLIVLFIYGKFKPSKGTIILLVLLCILPAIQTYSYAGEKTCGQIVNDLKEQAIASDSHTKDVTIYQHSKVYSPSNSTTLIKTILYKKGEMFKIQSHLKEPSVNYWKKETILFDGKELWTVSGGIKKKLTPNETQEFKIIMQKNWWDLTNDKSECSYISGNIEIRSKYLKGMLLSITFCVEDGRILEIKGTSDNASFKTHFADWKEVDNRKLPFRSEYFADSKLQSETIVDSIKFNTGLNDTVFNVQHEKTIDLKEVIKELFD